MASKPRKPIDLGLDNYNELFMNEQERMENRLPRIYTIPISEIDEFPDHPFQVRMDEDMDQLVESVKERGVITPVTLRKKEDGRYRETITTRRNEYRIAHHPMQPRLFLLSHFSLREVL